MIFFPAAASFLSPFGTLFLLLLKMCALPIVMTAVILSFVRLLRHENAVGYIQKISRVFAVGVLVAGVLGVVSGQFLGQQVANDPMIVQALSKLASAKLSPAEISSTTSPSIWGFVLNIIPGNIFHSLAEGELLGALLFVILLGISIGLSRGKEVDTFLTSVETLNEGLFRMMRWVTSLLPFGLAALLAQMFTSLGAGGVSVFGKIIGVSLLGLLAMVTVHILIIGLSRSAKGWANVFRELRKPFLIGFTSSSSLATMPSLSVGLHRGLGVEQWLSDLTLPLAISFNQHGSVFFYSFVCTLVAKIFGLPLGMAGAALIIMGSFLQAVTASGMPALASVVMLTAIFRPLGLPAEIILVTVSAILPLLDPFVTVTNLTGHAAATSLIHRIVKAEEGTETPEEESLEKITFPSPGIGR